MGLRQTIYTITVADGAVFALVGNRIYPDRVPEDATFPLIVFDAPISDDNSEYRTHDGNATERTRSRVQFNSYAATGAQAEAIADALYDLWDNYSSPTGCAVGYAFQANRFGTREDGINQYRQIQDFIIEHTT